MTTTVAGIVVQNRVEWKENTKGRDSAFSSLQKYKQELLGIKTQMTGLGDIKIKVAGLREAKDHLNQIREQAKEGKGKFRVPPVVDPLTPTTPRPPPNSPRSPKSELEKEAALRERMQARIKKFANSPAMQRISEQKAHHIIRELQSKEIKNERQLGVEISNHQRRLRNLADARRENIRLQKKQGLLQERMTASARQLAGEMASVYLAVQGIGSTIRVGMDFQKVESGMTAVSTDSKEAAGSIAFIRSESRRLGADLIQSSKGFTQMLAAGQGKIALEDMKELTTGVMEVSTVLGLSADDTAGSIRALNQMVSKGAVMSKTLDL